MLHDMGRMYGRLPSECMGLSPQSWKGWIINVHALAVGKRERVRLHEKGAMGVVEY